jgi:hypothetical protein
MICHTRTTSLCIICPVSAAKFILLAAVSSDDQQHVGILLDAPELRIHVAVRVVGMEP